MEVWESKGFLALLVISSCLMMGGAFANPFGTNITVADGSISGSSHWYGANGGHEDQEVEPGCVADQHWDLEGMFVNGDQLTLVGGFNFKNGVVNVVPGTKGKKSVTRVMAGDVFISTDGDIASQNSDNANSIIPNASPYDYVIHIINWNSTNIQYEVFQLNSNSFITATTPMSGQDSASNPWVYAGGGVALNGGQIYSVTYQSGLSDAYTGFKGDLAADKNGPGGKDFAANGPSHYAATFDLGWLNTSLAPGSYDLAYHFTEQNGNDSLMGVDSFDIAGVDGITPNRLLPVPEPASLLLMGLPLGGYVARRLKRQLV